MLESKVLNFNPPIISSWNERRDRMCVESHVATGHLGQLVITVLDGRQLGYSIICSNTLDWRQCGSCHGIAGFLMDELQI